MKPIVLKKRSKPGQCIVKTCLHGTTEGRKMCHGCRARKSKLADPVRYAFNTLRANAKRRNILFTITLEQFREFCYKVQYIGFKGRKSEGFTIDRIHNDLGYHIDNIQVLTNAQNVKKYFRYDRHAGRYYWSKVAA